MRTASGRSLRSFLLGTTAVALCAAGVSATSAVSAGPARADTAPAAGTPATVTADALPTVQQNGVIWSEVTVGNIVYATGSFSQTWPAGTTNTAANAPVTMNVSGFTAATAG